METDMKKKALAIGGIAVTAVLVGGWALEQLWLFWLAPLAGAVAAGVAYRALAVEQDRFEEGGLPQQTAAAQGKR